MKASEVVLTMLRTGLNMMVVLLLAPFLEGVLRKVTAFVQSRRGPPIWQGYYDLLKLLGKEDIESGEVPWLQRFAAYLGLASVLAIASLVPMGGPAPLNGMADVLVLIYMLGLSAVSVLLAGLAAGSTYALIGTSREVMALLFLEPILALSLVVGAVRTGSLRLNTVLDGSVYAGTGLSWSGLILLALFILSFPALLHRVPFDTAEAETELMDGPYMEYSGPKLALFKYAQMIKVILYGALFVGLFVPWINDLVFPLGLFAFFAALGVIILGLTWIAATHARFRIDQALKFYGVLILGGFAALGLAVFGH